MKIGLGSLQGVIFIKGLDLSNSLFLAQTFNSLNSIKFNGSPTIIPLPMDAPLEIPRIILRTTDNEFNLNISANRIDLFFTNNKLDESGTPTRSLIELEDYIIGIMVEISSLITTRLSVHIPRIALVVNNIIKLEYSSKKYLLDNFIKNEAIQKPDEMQLNFLIKNEVAGFKYNLWLRLNTLRNQKNLEDDKALLFILDINSLTETDYDFNKSSTRMFLKTCFSLLKKEIDQFSKKERNG